MAVSSMDIAWMAGILEGEACFMLRDRKVADSVYKGIYIQLVMTDEDIVKRVAALLGVNCKPCPWRPLSTKPIWRCQIHGDRAAGWMMTIYKFMSERRRAKIEQCLDAWRRSPGKTKLQRATAQAREVA